MSKVGNRTSLLGVVGVVGVVFGVLSLVLSYSVLPTQFTETFDRLPSSVVVGTSPGTIQQENSSKASEDAQNHIPTPEAVKAIYMTNWVAGTKSLRDPLVTLIEDTELNAVIIDIKDYTGKIGFMPNDPIVANIGSGEARIDDIDAFIDELHAKNIYVIGRISVFQDTFLVQKRPDLAVKRASDTSIPWSDHKGVKWLDAGNKEVWEYVRNIALEARSRGFDEINLDYIRFPSDGNMKDIYFPTSDGKQKSEVLESFFNYISAELRDAHGIPLSADVFGMVTTNTDDLNIGQVLEKALPYFDFVAPMVYPSHYPSGWNGLRNPAEHPYEVISLSMEKAVQRARAMGEDPLKLRPWLQDFDLGADYDAKKVRDQIRATYDVGLNSWMIWNASNRYTKDAYLTE